MKKILVTGSNGLLGQKLTELYLQQKNVQLIATARGSNRNPVQEGYIYEELDITSEEEVNRVMDKYRPHTVIHGAAMTNVDQCETDTAGCDALNVDAVSYMVAACNRYGTHLIALSTDFIFDGADGPYDEDAPASPLSYYGRSKLAGEQIVIDQAARWAILRTVLVYGVVNDMSRSNIVLWAKGALEAGKTITVVDDQFRTPTLAEDLAMGCLLAEQQEATGIYNISGSDFMSILELVQQVADFWQLDAQLIQPIKSNTLNQAARRPMVTGFRLDKAIRDLGYRPHTFRQGLEIVKAQLDSIGA